MKTKKKIELLIECLECYSTMRQIENNFFDKASTLPGVLAYISIKKMNFESNRINNSILEAARSLASEYKTKDLYKVLKRNNANFDFFFSPVDDPDNLDLPTTEDLRRLSNLILESVITDSKISAEEIINLSKDLTSCLIELGIHHRFIIKNIKDEMDRLKKEHLQLNKFSTENIKLYHNSYYVLVGVSGTNKLKDSHFSHCSNIELVVESGKRVAITPELGSQAGEFLKKLLVHQPKIGFIPIRDEYNYCFRVSVKAFDYSSAAKIANRKLEESLIYYTSNDLFADLRTSKFMFVYFQENMHNSSEVIINTSQSISLRRAHPTPSKELIQLMKIYSEAKKTTTPLNSIALYWSGIEASLDKNFEGIAKTISIQMISQSVTQSYRILFYQYKEKKNRLDNLSQQRERNEKTIQSIQRQQVIGSAQEKSLNQMATKLSYLYKEVNDLNSEFLETESDFNILNGELKKIKVDPTKNEETNEKDFIQLKNVIKWQNILRDTFEVDNSPLNNIHQVLTPFAQHTLSMAFNAMQNAESVTRFLNDNYSYFLKFLKIIYAVRNIRLHSGEEVFSGSELVSRVSQSTLDLLIETCLFSGDSKLPPRDQIDSKFIPRFEHLISMEENHMSKENLRSQWSECSQQE